MCTISLLCVADIYFHVLCWIQAVNPVQYFNKDTSITYFFFVGDILPVSELMGNIESILDTQLEPTEDTLGILTTHERNQWAKTREHICSLSEKNSKQFDEIDAALFVLCLDDIELGTDPVTITKHFLHSDGTNRQANIC